MTLTGFVGLGDQGAPMGERVLASGPGGVIEYASRVRAKFAEATAP